MNKLSVVQLDLRHHRVLLRADLNVPLAGEEILDDSRLRAVIPTIEYCLESGAAVVLASHLGRPAGRRDPRYSLKPVLFRLEELLGRPIPLAPDCVGPLAEKLAKALRPGQCLLLENLRFHDGEEADDAGFAEELARLGTCYVNDAFSTCHRAHASVSAVTRFLQPAAIGLLMQRELLALAQLLDHPRHPVALILGGARASDKLGLIKNLISKVDRLLVGGAVAFTFLQALGGATGQSPVEKELIATAMGVLEEAARRNVEVVLPDDVVISRHPGDRATISQSPAARIPIAMTGLDIGPLTLARFRAGLRDTATVLWNGPVGVFEHPPFATGTMELARILADHPGWTVAAGSDTAAAIRRAGVCGRIGYVSTAGTAFLQALEGRELPGVAGLSEARSRKRRTRMA